MQRYNDYELIYLIQSENSEQALKIMMDKYKNFIYKMIYRYNFDEYEVSDYYQESLYLMYELISKFDEKRGKTFMRLYELVLKRRIHKLNLRKPRYELHENFDVYEDTSNKTDELNLEMLTSFEKEVFSRYLIKNQKIAFIGEELKKTDKQIYNAIYRIKEKYKNNML